MSFEPGTRNDAFTEFTIADFEGGLRCFQCGHTYDYLGDGVHPGSCPQCEGRVVSFAGEPRAVAPRTGTGDSASRRLSPLFKVTVCDATDRQFEYFIAYPEGGESQRPMPILRYVRVGDHRVHATAEHWDDRLVPACVLNVVQELTGRGLLVPSESTTTNRSWDRDSDHDEDDGGIGVRRDR